MKKICMLILLAVLSVTQATATTYYVDPDDGDDSWPGTYPSYIVGPIDGPFKTIKHALETVNSGDTIKLLDGDFLEAMFSTTASGSNPWDVSRKVQINVDTNNITFDKYSGDPTIIGYDEGDSGFQYVMRIDEVNVTVKNITFDGEYVHPGDTFYVECLGVVALTPDADGAEVNGCVFTNFGSSPSDDIFMACIGGGDHRDVTNFFDDVVISYNTFYDNDFDTSHAHEIYLNRATDVEIKSNTIYNNGVGTPLRFSDDCDNVVIENNEVHGASWMGFICDYDKSVDGSMGSSNFIVKNNDFYGATTTPYSASVASNYQGAFTSGGKADPYERVPYIKEWSNNTVALLGNRQWDIKGIATDGSKLFMSCNDLHSTDEKANYLLEFGEHNGPIIDGRGGFEDGYQCDGNMIVFNQYVYISTKNGSDMKLYQYDTASGSSPSAIISGATSSLEITAMCPYDSNYFFTAVKQNDNGTTYSRIYKCNASTFLNDCIYETSSSNTITELAALASSSKIMFSIDNGSSNKIYSATVYSSGDITPSELENISYDITGMTFKGTTLVTAIQYSTTSRIYTGTTSQPLPQSGGSFSVDSHVDYFTSTNIIALEADSEFIFTIKNKTTDADEQRIIYFTDTASVLDNDIIFHAKWYTGNISL